MNIIGAGGLAREIAFYANNSRMRENIYFYETGDVYKKTNNALLFENRLANEMFLIAIGNGAARKRIVEKYNKVQYTFFISEQSIFGCETNEGLIVCPGCVVTDNVKFGKHVIVNLNSTIGHDCVIGDYVTIAPGVNISGNVKIGNGVTIGTNACIRENLEICDNAIIGMGAVVVKSISDEEGVFFGNPAKKHYIIKEL